MSLLDPNLDVNITERTLYELEVKKLFRGSNYKYCPINNIFYHRRVKEDNRWKWLMFYNINTHDIRFFDTFKQPGPPWNPVYEYTKGALLIISLCEVFDNLSQYEN